MVLFGEAWFFAGNGLAVVIEGGGEDGYFEAQENRKRRRGRGKWVRRMMAKSLERWYDGLVGRGWWICVLLYTGRNFARGWVRAGLVREMAGL